MNFKKMLLAITLGAIAHQAQAALAPAQITVYNETGLIIMATVIAPEVKPTPEKSNMVMRQLAPTQNKSFDYTPNNQLNVAHASAHPCHGGDFTFITGCNHTETIPTGAIAARVFIGCKIVFEFAQAQAIDAKIKEGQATFQ